MASTSPATTLPALKEWAVVCDLLLAGRQAVLFRKGGIDEKGFWVEAPGFYLFPTGFHQNGDKIREEFRADFEEAARGEHPAGRLRMRGFCEVVEAVEVRAPDRVGELRDLHPYTGEQIAMRLEFRPKKPLVLVVVRARALLENVEMAMREEFGGCVSWVDAGLGAPALADPVLDDETLRSLARRVRETVG